MLHGLNWRQRRAAVEAALAVQKYARALAREREDPTADNWRRLVKAAEERRVRLAASPYHGESLLDFLERMFEG